MINPYLLRKNIDEIVQKLSRRGFNLDKNQFCELEKKRKILQEKTERLQARHHLQSKLIGQAKARGENAFSLLLEVNQLRKYLDQSKYQLKILQSKIRDISLQIPNLPDVSVPTGDNKNFNVEIKRWGTPRQFNFSIRDHVELGEIHNGLDFSSAAKLTGARFVVMKGKIAHLQRALTQFMLDLHTKKHGYNEIYVPYLVNHETLYGTGHLPKFSNDLFHICSSEKKEKINNYALIPTSEVPLINLMRDKILNESDLPIKLTAHSPCFRSEAGSYGRDTRGLIRMHQFDKVEIVQIVHPKNSMSVLEDMTKHAENVLELLGLPYRRVLLCTGDMSFSACKTYDLEVWIPSLNSYYEISSCSNVLDFQARRIQARFRSIPDKKICLVHTLNGSGLAISRSLVAVLENYQQSDGCIQIPDILRPYMQGKQYIER